jgi:hypothetical protein
MESCKAKILIRDSFIDNTEIPLSEGNYCYLHIFFTELIE